MPYSALHTQDLSDDVQAVTSSICLIGGHRLVRLGLTKILTERGFAIAGEFASKSQLKKFRQVVPDHDLGIAILILSSGAYSSIHQTREIIEALPAGSPLIILSENTARSEVYTAIRFGTRAYLSLDCEPAELERAIVTISKGKVYLSPDIAAVLVNDVSAAFEPNRSGKLTSATLSKRENEIVQLLCEGLSSKEIARKLHLSAKTIENHRYKIYRKCEVESITSLMRFAIQQGIVTI